MLRPLTGFLVLCLVAALLLTGATLQGLGPVPDSLAAVIAEAGPAQLLDRRGEVLTRTYESRWNLQDHVALHAVPPLLVAAFLTAEDRRFFAHGGMDWRARGAALVQNLAAGRRVRGASTITEQVVRMLHPRPRTLWSRWLEGFEARALERRFSKSEILEFYLNQVPYAARRRGVVQAARYHFGRELDTLSTGEILALAVLVRAPSALDPRQHPGRLERPVAALAARLRGSGTAGEAVPVHFRPVPSGLPGPNSETDLTHFARQVRAQARGAGLDARTRLRTTLDASLQRTTRALLQARLGDLEQRRVPHGAVLVVEHASGAVRAWASAVGSHADGRGAWIDAVRTPRQPGSTLKPFLYALALERGWSAATRLDDSPLAEAVGSGLHHYRNFSRRHYGTVSLREALGNSLNIPAVRTLQALGPALFLQRLQWLGFASLGRHPEDYGDGLALGNGEVSLYELVRAYATLARGGVHRDLQVLEDVPGGVPERRVFDSAVSSLVADILADPEARRLEFGGGGLLDLPLETAVKTGTSTAYRDAWAVGFDHRHTVGVWMGDLERRATAGVTGSGGPALLLRAVFAELNRHGPGAPLWRSPALLPLEVCRDTGRPAADGDCPRRREWFIAGTGAPPAEAPRGRTTGARIASPTEGLVLALDPRIPDALEAFELTLDGAPAEARVEWLLNGESIGEGMRYQWPLARGRHRLQARVAGAQDSAGALTREVSFEVR